MGNTFLVAREDFMSEKSSKKTQSCYLAIEISAFLPQIFELKKNVKSDLLETPDLT